jgi:hypothetical protein
VSATSCRLLARVDHRAAGSSPCTPPPPCAPLSIGEQPLAPVTWREWERVSRLARERLGVGPAQLGEMRVVDVLRALRDATPGGADERETVTCRGCGGLALEVDARGRCRLCAADSRTRRACRT